MNLWGDAAEYAAYILNRSPNKANGGEVSPIELLTKKKLNLKDIAVFIHHARFTCIRTTSR